MSEDRYLENNLKTASGLTKVADQIIKEAQRQQNRIPMFEKGTLNRISEREFSGEPAGLER